MNPQPKLSICLFSDANFIAVNLLENLLSKNCVVNVVSNNIDEWAAKTTQLSAKNKFGFVQMNIFNDKVPYDYAIFCGGFIDTGSAYKYFNYFNSFKNLTLSKRLILFPLDVFERNQLDKIHISDNTAVLFIGDLLGPRINLNSNLLMPRCLSEILWKRKLTLAAGEPLTPIFVSDAAKVMVKWLFSFGPYGKVTLLLGSQISGGTFWISNKKYFNDLVFSEDTKKPARVIPKDIETVTLNSNLGFSLGETYAWLKNNWADNLRPSIKNKGAVKKIVRKKWAMPKHYARAIWGLIILLAFPFVTLLFSLLVSFIAYKSFISGNDNFAQNSFLISRTFAVVSEKGSNIFSYIPGVGLIYKEVDFAAVLAERTNSIGIHLIPVVRNATQLFGDVLGDVVYNPFDNSSKMESEIVLLYNDVVSIKSLTDEASEKNIVLAKKILGKIDFERFIKLLSESRVLVGNIPALLGQDKSKTYLILFENNMELRPTGGFIGSFGLFTFDKGRLSDLTVNDVYSADGQLNGHVEPPLPIKKYLGEANWWLRDSNWDPDFPTSAKRAEWFLDKELSKDVDGVFSVDLFPIKEILKSTGPIFLSDYDMSITSDNLYEKTQSEVENNFFAGTHKKASFLTALSRSLLAEVTKLDVRQKFSILKTFYNSFNERHIQAYLHDSSSQEAFSVLGWDGAVAVPTCGTGCYADTVGLVEANLGVNKVNYFIQRNIGLDVTIGASGIDHKLTVTLKNNANPALGPSGRYINYLRIMIPSDASISSLVGYNGGVQENLTPELTDAKGRKEVGVLVELLAGNTKNIELSWTSGSVGVAPFTNYGLYVRKQAGTDADPIKLSFRGTGIGVKPDPRLTLTRGGSYGYNTTLAQDLFFRLSW